MTFEALGLAPSITKVIKEQEFKAPTPIQVEAIPHILKQKDVLGPVHLPLQSREEEPVDVMIGSRYVRHGGVKGWPLHRRLINANALS